MLKGTGVKERDEIRRIEQNMSILKREKIASGKRQWSTDRKDSEGKKFENSRRSDESLPRKTERGINLGRRGGQREGFSILEPHNRRRVHVPSAYFRGEDKDIQGGQGWKKKKNEQRTGAALSETANE